MLARTGKMSFAAMAVVAMAVMAVPTLAKADDSTVVAVVNGDTVDEILIRRDRSASSSAIGAHARVGWRSCTGLCEHSSGRICALT